MFCSIWWAGKVVRWPGSWSTGWWSWWWRPSLILIRWRQCLWQLHIHYTANSKGTKGKIISGQLVKITVVIQCLYNSVNCSILVASYIVFLCRALTLKYCKLFLLLFLQAALFAIETLFDSEYEPVPVFVSETQSQPHTHDCMLCWRLAAIIFL